MSGANRNLRRAGRWKSGRGAELLLLGLLALPGLARGQDAEIPVELQETNIHGMGARVMGMGQTFVGVADDLAAIEFNPAGLTQILGLELSTGLAHDEADRTLTHAGAIPVSDGRTRLDYIGIAYGSRTRPRRPGVPQREERLAWAFAFHRRADLSQKLFKEGLILAPAGAQPGLFELEDYRRSGTVNAWTGAFAYRTGAVSFGATLSYLTGSSNESWTMANYRAENQGGEIAIDEAIAIQDERAFHQFVERDASLYGWTGSLGLMVQGGEFIRLGGSVDFPAWLRYDGSSYAFLEDWEKIDETEFLFRDEITLPLSLRGGASLRWAGLTAAADVRWTDYAQIDFEGEILAPPGGTSFLREPAYRSVVEYHVGAEWRLPLLPFRVRAGVFNQPLPYRLIAADTDFVFEADQDGDPNTIDGQSQLFRDYPEAVIETDRMYYTAGAGVIVRDRFSLDAAYVHGEWERRTPDDYENATEFYPATTTAEKFTEDRFFLSTTFWFR